MKYHNLKDGSRYGNPSIHLIEPISDNNGYCVASDNTYEDIINMSTGTFTHICTRCGWLIDTEDSLTTHNGYGREWHYHNSCKRSEDRYYGVEFNKYNKSWHYKGDTVNEILGEQLDSNNLPDTCATCGWGVIRDMETHIRICNGKVYHSDCYKTGIEDFLMSETW